MSSTTVLQPSPSQRRADSSTTLNLDASTSSIRPQMTAKRGSDVDTSQSGNVEERVNKRVRVEGFAEGKVRTAKSSTGGLSKGEQWLLDQVKLMEKQYKEVLLAATAVVQYQAYSLRLQRSVPIHLQRKLNFAYGAYQATHRQTQTYMNDAAQHAATPSHPVLVPTPAAPPSLHLDPALQAPIPLASPVPLSTASMLSFQPAPTDDLAQVQTQGLPLTTNQMQLPDLPVTTQATQGVPAFNTDSGSQVQIHAQPFYNPEIGISNGGSAQLGTTASASNINGMDLSGLGIGDINAIINSQGFDFSNFATNDINGTNGQASVMINQMRTFTNGPRDQQNMPAGLEQAPLVQNATMNDQGQPQNGKSQDQTNVDAIFASLSNDQSDQVLPPVASTDFNGDSSAAGQTGNQSRLVSNDNSAVPVVDLTALGDDQGDAGMGEFQFDFSNSLGGELDLSELVGLFGDSGDGTAGGDGNQIGSMSMEGMGDQSAQVDAGGQALPADQSIIQGQSQAIPAQPQAELPVLQKQTQSQEVPFVLPGQDLSTSMPPSLQQGQQGISQGPASTLGDRQNVDPNTMSGQPEVTENYGELGAIDMDDFNFGDNTLDMEGDEFESLLAEFK